MDPIKFSRLYVTKLLGDKNCISEQQQTQRRNIQLENKNDGHNINKSIQGK